MKVLRHGNMYIEKEIECKHCWALLSYCNKDVIVEKDCYEGFYGGWHTFHREYIVCPECDKKLYFTYQIDGREIEI